MNSTAQRACEADKTDKHHAEDLDDRMQQLRNTSSRLGMYPGVEELDNTSVYIFDHCDWIYKTFLRDNS